MLMLIDIPKELLLSRDCFCCVVLLYSLLISYLWCIYKPSLLHGSKGFHMNLSFFCEYLFFPFPILNMTFGFVSKLMFSQNGGERCSSGVLMRRAFHKPCALTPCAHSGAGGVASLATSLGPPAGVTAKHINFRIKQTSLWNINF